MVGAAFGGAWPAHGPRPASACASYLNLSLLWRALRREGIYQAQPGWLRHDPADLRLLAMVAVLWAGMTLWPDWASLAAGARVLRLSGLIAAGSAAFVVALFAGGFRLRDLRGP